MTITKNDLKELKEIIIATREEMITKQDMKMLKEEIITEIITVTRKDLKEAFYNFRKKDLKEAFDDFRRKDLRIAFEMFRKKDLREEFEKFEVKIERKIDESVLSLRILIEELRSDVKFSFEARSLHEDKLQVHGEILEKHDKKITTLEDYVYTKDRLK